MSGGLEGFGSGVVGGSRWWCDAAEVRQVKAAVEQERIEASVYDAAKKGKIAPTRIRHWLSLIQADPGMADVLAFVPENTVSVKEIGHGVDREGPPPDADADVCFR